MACSRPPPRSGEHVLSHGRKRNARNPVSVALSSSGNMHVRGGCSVAARVDRRDVTMINTRPNGDDNTQQYFEPRRHCPFDGDPQAKSDRRRHDFIVQRALRGRSPGRVSPAHDQGDGRLPLELDAARGLLVSLRRGNTSAISARKPRSGMRGPTTTAGWIRHTAALAAVSGSGGGRTTRGRVLASGEPPVGHRGSGRSEDLRSAPVRDRHPLGLAELPATRGQRVAPRERGRLDAAALSLLVRLQRAGRPAELPPHTTVGRHRTRDPRSTSRPMRC